MKIVPEYFVWVIPKGHPLHVGDTNTQKCDEVVVVHSSGLAPTTTMSPGWYRVNGRESGAYVGPGRNEYWKPDMKKIDELISQYRTGPFESKDLALAEAERIAKERNCLVVEVS